MEYNTTLSSSAPVERLFSFITMLDLPQYECLPDELFEARTISRANVSFSNNDNTNEISTIVPCGTRACSPSRTHLNLKTSNIRMKINERFADL
ncbi:hypothetical protein ANTPLA_LOCUS6392 [Anthophora plagiata]